MNALVAQCFIYPLFLFKIPLLLIIVDPGEPLHHGAEIFFENSYLVRMGGRHRKTQHNE